MSLASWILEHIAPGYRDSKERFATAMQENSKANDLLTAELQRAAFQPEKTQRIMRVNGHHK